MRKAKDIFSPRGKRVSTPEDRPTVPTPSARGIIMPPRLPGGRQVVMPEGTAVDPYQEQYQSAYDRYLQTLDAQQAVNTEAAGALPEYIEPMRMNRNQALLAGGIAALGSLLGARNAPQALGQYMGNSSQLLDQRTQDARARESDLAARTQAAIGARGANLELDRQRAQLGMDDAASRIKARTENEQAAFDRAIKVEELGLKRDEFGLRAGEFDLKVRQYEDGTVAGQIAELLQAGVDPEQAMGMVLAPMLEGMYQANEAKTKAWIASELADTEVEAGRLRPAEVQARIKSLEAQPLLNLANMFMDYAVSAANVQLGRDRLTQEGDLARARLALQQQELNQSMLPDQSSYSDAVRMVNSLSQALDRLKDENGDFLPGTEEQVAQIQSLMDAYLKMAQPGAVQPGAGIRLGGQAGALGALASGVAPGYAPFNPFGAGAQIAPTGPQVPPQYKSIIDSAAAQFGLDPTLLASVAMVESGFNPSAASSKGARGLFQLMPGTARELGVTDPTDPTQSAMGGAKYLAQLLQRFGDVRLALAAYNAGPGAVEKYGGIPPFEETQNFVQRVLAAYGGQ